MTRNDVAEISMATGEWGKTKAFVTVKLSCGLVMNGVKVVQGKKGLFVGMPSIQRKNKETQEMEWKDCCLFEEEEDRNTFRDIVVEAYNAKVSGGAPSRSQDTTMGKDEDETSFF